MTCLDTCPTAEPPARPAAPLRPSWLSPGLVAGSLRALDRALVVLVTLVAAVWLGAVAAIPLEAALIPALVGVAALALARLLATGLAARWRRSGRLARNLVVVGAGEQGHRFVEHLTRHDGDVRLIGVFDDRATRVPGWVGHFPVLGTIDDLVGFAAHQPIDEVVLALPWTAEQRIATCLERLRRIPATVRLCPDLVAYRLTGRAVETIHGIPLIEVQSLPFTGWRRVAKAAEDRVLAGLGLALCAPLLALLALLVRLDGGGPVLVREQHYDFNDGAVVLRSFRAGAEGSPMALLDRSGLARLPRLLDVLAGTVSLVGPRSHDATSSLGLRRLVDDALARYRVKPGLVSLADLEGEDADNAGEGLDRRLLLDRAYVERWSLSLDLRILARALV